MDIKLTTSNYQSIITDMLYDTATARTNVYYFSVTDINESTIRQAAWDYSILLNFASVDGFISTVSFSKIINS